MEQDFREGQEQKTRDRANLLGIPYIDSRSLHQTPLIKDLLTLQEMYELKMAPLSKDNQNITFAVTIQTHQPDLEKVRGRNSDFITNFVMISEEGMREIMLRYDPPKVPQYADIDIKHTTETKQNIQDISKQFETVRSDDILKYLIKQAYNLNASDIHLETEKTKVRMRFRVDGTLHPVADITHEKYKQLSQSIAVKANISTTSPDAQTGHLSEQIKLDDGSEMSLNMRIETVPTNFGQDAVIRLLNMTEDLLDVEKLGLAGPEKENIDEIIEHPHGMVLVVGPTGSGKTTTLYSILRALNHPNRKLITLEDPVEYGFEGISQIPIDSRAGKKFADGLRAVLRLDPDVIMVGEIRDVDTAKTALQASLTGHLVLSTFHAADASAAMSRMLDMIGENPLFVSAMKMVIAQRLVRRLDDATKVEYEPDEQLKSEVSKILEDLPEKFEKPNLDGIKLYKPGKSEQNPFGYQGRIMITEQLKMTSSLRELIAKGTKETSTEQIRESAVKDGMKTMLQDGVLKAINGETTIEEVYRVVD